MFSVGINYSKELIRLIESAVTLLEKKQIEKQTESKKHFL